jgi:hypothetical protein
VIDLWYKYAVLYCLDVGTFADGNGWGELAFLTTSQPEVLAHACTWKGRTVAAVHNFSRARRTVEVQRPDGTQNVQHLFGRGVPERAQGLLDLVDLDGYDYRWVRLDIAR